MRNYDTTILECYGMILTNKGNQIEQAAKILGDLYKSNNKYIPVLNALAICKLL